MGKKPYYLKQCMFLVFYSKVPVFAYFQVFFFLSCILSSCAAEIRKQELNEEYNSLKVCKSVLTLKS